MRIRLDHSKFCAANSMAESPALTRKMSVRLARGTPVVEVQVTGFGAKGITPSFLSLFFVLRKFWMGGEMVAAQVC